MKYVVTGGAGFIGSNIVAEIERRELGEIIVFDDLGSQGKWMNLANRRSAISVLPTENMFDVLRVGSQDGLSLIHMGAHSSTTENDAGKLASNNSQLTKILFNLAASKGWRFIYASSASVYGASRDQSDDDDAALTPLNAYAWSKALADRAVIYAAKWDPPPLWAGLRFFNVYGPNEEHKGGDKSFITRCFDSIREGKAITFFRGSDEFKRDWVYVDDCARLVVDLITSDFKVGGIFNVGTGKPESFVEVAQQCIGASRKQAAALTEPFPLHLVGRYQGYTKADTTKLRSVMADFQFKPLAQGVKDYWNGHGSRDGLDRYS